MTIQRTRFIGISNSTFDTIVPPLKTMKLNSEDDAFLDYDPKLFRHLINQLRRRSVEKISSFELSLKKEKTAFERMLIDLNIFVVATTTTSTTTTTTTTRTISKSKPREIEVNRRHPHILNDYHLYFASCFLFLI